MKSIQPKSLQLGRYLVSPPIVLAPMAGVTNAAFRTMCRRFAPDLIYVNEMVMAAAIVNRNAKTERMATFGPGDSPRSLQIYGSDPVTSGEAVRQLCAEDRVDHIDLNFGCPARKVTRRGGGAAVPVKPNLLRAILRSVVGAASPYGVAVTAKFRMGIDDELLTYIRTGQIAEDEGVVAIALHARTAQQHYAGNANWDAIGELKAAVSSIPVLGNGDIWEARDALAMVAQTGCDGVVIGRGCLGRPWLFGHLSAAFNGEPVPDSPPLGFVAQQMADHCRLMADLLGENNAVRDFRKHTSWYLTGYPVGGEIRGRLAMFGSLAELDDLLATLDPAIVVVPGGERIRRGHTNGPIRVVLPQGYLDDLDDATPPDDAHVMALSGG